MKKSGALNADREDVEKHEWLSSAALAEQQNAWIEMEEMKITKT